MYREEADGRMRSGGLVFNGGQNDVIERLREREMALQADGKQCGSSRIDNGGLVFWIRAGRSMGQVLDQLRFLTTLVASCKVKSIFEFLRRVRS